jgi:hypothetical protein
MIVRLEPHAMARRGPNKRAYYHPFFAQVIALVSTGVATGALALLAYELAGADTDTVMGTALAIKMLAYVRVVTNSPGMLMTSSSPTASTALASDSNSWAMRERESALA